MISHLEDMNYIENINDYNFINNILLLTIYLLYFLNFIIFYILDYININREILINFLNNYTCYSLIFFNILLIIYKFFKIFFNILRSLFYFLQIIFNIILTFFYLKNIYNFNIKFIFKKNEVCPICLENNVNCVTKCNHYFHFTCLFKWIKINKKCPICREKLY